VHLGDVGLLLLAGVGAGVVGSTAGLASLVSYPVLLLVGLSPVTANVTNTVALVGSSIGSVAGSRPELRGLRGLVGRRLPVALLGGAAGAVALLASPPGSFERVVPGLVALASVLLLLSPRLRRLGSGSGSGSRAGASTEGGPLTIGALLLCCVYGGYFGAAAGVMILALLLSRTDHSLPVSNALKNVLLGAANATAAVLFAVTSPVAWAAVPPLLLGCVVGGRVGPSVVRRLPADLVRWAVGLAGLGLAVRLAVG
jgi:uncharacterized membrane protein YfcA